MLKSINVTRLGLFLLAAACADSVEPEARATLVVRNRLSDTIATVQIGACQDSVLNPKDLLQMRERLFPEGERAVTMDPGCHDARFLNVRDSLVDARTQINVSAGDTFIVVLQRE
jgi:hypothetical protein